MKHSRQSECRLQVGGALTPPNTRRECGPGPLTPCLSHPWTG